MSLAVVSSMTHTTEDGIVLPHLFTELPITPKTNGHQQAAVEPDLESLLPATAEPPKYAMNHGGQKELPLSLSLMLRDLEGGEGRGERLSAPRPGLNRPALKMHPDSVQLRCVI